MEESFLEAINRIAQKEPVELVPEEIAFLKARESYLTPEQLEKFKEVLIEKKEVKVKSKKSK